jgi:hypothetical protein
MDLPPASVGSQYRAELPAFSDPGGKGLSLTAAGVPEGMRFSDLGDGRGALEGAPARAGNASLQVVAANHNGRTAQMLASIAIAEPHHEDAPGHQAAPLRPPARPPAPVNPPPQSETGSSPDEKTRAFINAFDGGDCFFVDSLRGGPAHAYQAVGDELAPFHRFDSAYASEFGVKADLTVALIARDQCPALDLIRLGGGARDARPRIELDNYTVTRGKPLTGKVSNLSGRRLYLVLVDNEGAAYKLDARQQPGSDEATFSIPLTPDANSVGSMQVLLALASSKPIPALDSLRQAAPLKPMIARLLDAAREASASVEGDYFRLSN